MNSLLTLFSALLVLALSALFAAPLFIDWNDYRSVFEEQASALVGRKVDVGGNVSLTLLPAPVLRFESVNVADENGSFDTPFAAAKSFSVWLAVPPLLSATLEARQVELDEPVVNLKLGEGGEPGWKDIGQSATGIPFMPEKVALESVKITGGTLNLLRADGPMLSLDKVSGELSARSLEGPYKFSGTFEHAASPRVLRFSTGRREADGSVRLKAVLNDIEAEFGYSLDGTISGFSTAPRYDGQFTMRAEGDPAQQRVIAAAGDAPLEVKSQLTADAAQARFHDAEITVRRNGKQQAFTGSLVVDYGGEPHLDARLAARLLDLDGLFPAANPEQTPLARIADAAMPLLEKAVSLGDGRLDLKLNQAAVGGDVIKDISAELRSRKGALTLERFDAMLPGESRLSLNGALRAREGHAGFSGDVDMSGGRLSRLLLWAGTQAAPIAAEGSGDFSIRGRVALGPESIVIEEASGELLGSSFTGGLKLRSQEPRELDIRLRSDRLDLARALGADALPSLTSLLPGGGASGGKDGDGEKKGALGWLFDASTRLDLGVGSVSLPGLGAGALEADVTAKDGSVRIDKFSFASSGGLTLKAAGRLADLGGHAGGDMSVTMDAGNAEAFKLLAGLFDLPEPVARNDARAKRLSPASLKLDVKSRPDNKGLDGTLRGTLAQSRVEAHFDFDGALADSAGARLSLEGKLDNPKGRELLGQLFPSVGTAEGYPQGEGSASIAVSGVPRTGIDTSVSVSGAGVDIRIKGRAAFPEDGASFEGDAEVKAGDAVLLAGLAGRPADSRGGGNAFHAKGSVTLKNKLYRVASLTGEAGGAPFTGRGELDLSGAAPRFSGSIKAREASLPLLLSPVLSDQVQQEAPAVRSVRPGASVWPERGFETELIESASGDFSLEAGRLRLLGAMVLKDATLKAELSGGELSVTEVRGGLYGGSFSGSTRLGKRGGGMAFEANAKATGLSVGEIVKDVRGKPLAQGKAELSLSVNGEGLTPNGIAAGLGGQGKLSVSAGRIMRLAPGAPRSVVAAASRTPREQQPSGDKLASLAFEALARGDLAFSGVEVPFVVRNGVVRFDKTELAGKDGWASVASFLELSSLRLDSEWVVSAVKPDTEGAEPQIALAFVGPVEDLGRISPDMEVEPLERFVTIARMEKDVETLEKLDVTP
ncbi:MAG: AsmA family protein, partial [Hyphomicrobiales bacterium]